MFFFIVLTRLYTTTDLLSTGNTRKYQQIDVYIYQSVVWNNYNGLLTLTATVEVEGLEGEEQRA